MSPIPKESPNQKSKTRERLESMVSDFETFFIRKAASAIGISPTLVYHILHDDLHLKPYKFHQWHKLEDQDYQKRLDFAKWFLKISLNSRQFVFLVTKLIFI